MARDTQNSNYTHGEDHLAAYRQVIWSPKLALYEGELCYEWQGREVKSSGTFDWMRGDRALSENAVVQQWHEYLLNNPDTWITALWRDNDPQTESDCAILMHCGDAQLGDKRGRVIRSIWVIQIPWRDYQRNGLERLLRWMGTTIPLDVPGATLDPDWSTLGDFRLAAGSGGRRLKLGPDESAKGYLFDRAMDWSLAPDDGLVGAEVTPQWVDTVLTAALIRREEPLHFNFPGRGQDFSAQLRHLNTLLVRVGELLPPHLVPTFFLVLPKNALPASFPCEFNLSLSYWPKADAAPSLPHLKRNELYAQTYVRYIREWIESGDEESRLLFNKISDVESLLEWISVRFNESVMSRYPVADSLGVARAGLNFMQKLQQRKLLSPVYQRWEEDKTNPLWGFRADSEQELEGLKLIFSEPLPVSDVRDALNLLLSIAALGSDQPGWRSLPSERRNLILLLKSPANRKTAEQQEGAIQTELGENLGLGLFSSMPARSEEDHANSAFGQPFGSEIQHKRPTSIRPPGKAGSRPAALAQPQLLSLEKSSRKTTPSHPLLTFVSIVLLIIVLVFVVAIYQVVNDDRRQPSVVSVPTELAPTLITVVPAQPSPSATPPATDTPTPLPQPSDTPDQASTDQAAQDQVATDQAVQALRDEVATARVLFPTQTALAAVIETATAQVVFDAQARETREAIHATAIVQAQNQSANDVYATLTQSALQATQTAAAWTSTPVPSPTVAEAAPTVEPATATESASALLPNVAEGATQTTPTITATPAPVCFIAGTLNFPNPPLRDNAGGSRTGETLNIDKAPVLGGEYTPGNGDSEFWWQVNKESAANQPEAGFWAGAVVTKITGECRAISLNLKGQAAGAFDLFVASYVYLALPVPAGTLTVTCPDCTLIRVPGLDAVIDAAAGTWTYTVTAAGQYAMEIFADPGAEASLNLSWAAPQQ